VSSLFSFDGTLRGGRVRRTTWEEEPGQPRRFTLVLKHPGPSFSDHYVFPDGELVPLGVTLGIAESSGFEVRDAESLREHYVFTLRQLVRRL
jgi:cyclopropane-fatty-acyl-phospholipid synthase